MEKFVATLFALCAVGLGIASLATTHWQDLKGKHAHYGLFQSCLSMSTGFFKGKLVLCANNLDNTGKLLLGDIWKHNEWFIPILVVHVCAVTISFIGTILWVTSFCQGGVGLKVATVFLSIIASGCYLGSVTMWKFEFVGKRNISTHGYSFWCAVSATICMILGTLLMIIGLVRTRNYVPVSQS